MSPRKIALKVSLGIQSWLIVLMLMILIPIISIQAFNYYDSYRTRRAEELKANLEVARSAGKTFNAFVQDVLHLELAIGITATRTYPHSSDGLIRLLERSSGEIPAISSFHWLSPQGRILASSDQEAVAIDASDRAYFQEIASGREWAISDLIYGKLSGKPIFAISRAIRDERGRLLGLVVATVVPEKLDAVLAFHRMGDAGVSLIDSKGMHVYRYPATKYSREQSDWLKAYPSLRDALKGRDATAMVTSKLTGKERLVGFAPVPSTGWVSAASRTVDDAMEPVTSALLWQVCGFLCIALTSVICALRVSRGIARPMETIHRQTLSLGRGNWDEYISVSGPKEVQSLAEALNWMAMERKQAEKELMESEAKFRSLFENSKNDENTIKKYALRLLGIEEDLRRSIARDLHDDIAQELTALSLNLAYVRNHLEDGPQNKLMPVLDDAKTQTMEVSRRVRNLMVELHPLQLEESGLAVAIRMHAVQFTNRFGIEVNMTADSRCPRLTSKKETAIFRIAQEAMSNIVKHAAATRVTIFFGKVGEVVRLAITDDGKGFVHQEESPQITGCGWGLTNMRERARLIEGVLAVHSSLGQGTTISFEIREIQ